MKPAITCICLIVACTVLAGAECTPMQPITRQLDLSSFDEFAYSRQAIFGVDDSLPFSEARITHEEDDTYWIEFTPLEIEQDSGSTWEGIAGADSDWRYDNLDPWDAYIYGFGYTSSLDTHDWGAPYTSRRKLDAAEVRQMQDVFGFVQTRTDFFGAMCIDPGVFTTLRWDEYQLDTIAGCDIGFVESLESESGDEIEEMLLDFYQAGETWP